MTRKTLYALTLGLAGMVGCATTEVTPSQLESRLADGQMDLTDLRATYSARASFAQKFTQAQTPEEKVKYSNLMSDVGQLITAYKNGAKLKLKLTTDFWGPAGDLMSLDGTKDSERFVSVTYKNLVDLFDAPRADKLLEGAVLQWGPTTDRVKTLVGITPEEMVKAAKGNRSYAVVVDDIFAKDGALTPVAGTQAAYVVADKALDVKDFDFKALNQEPKVVEPEAKATEKPKAKEAKKETK